MIDCKTAANIVNYSDNVSEAEVLFRPGTMFRINKIWTRDENGNVPNDAPAEVQMILHKKGNLVDQLGNAVDPSNFSGKKFQIQVFVVSEVG